MTLLFLCLYILELQPTYLSQPSNPSTVEEGRELILQWNYDLDGQSNLLTLLLNVTAGESGSPPTIAKRQNNDNASVEAGYENLFRTIITDTQATLTILAVPKSINGEEYLLRIVTSPSFLTLQSASVEISVLCKYPAYFLYIKLLLNINKIC